LKNCLIPINPQHLIVHETPSTTLVHGGKGFNLVAEPKSLGWAIEKTKTAGTVWVAVYNSYHSGIADYFAMTVLDEEMIGIATNNTNPLVATTFGRSGMLGTNPLSVTIPAGKDYPFVADCATVSASGGILDVLNNIGKKVPKGMLEDEESITTNDPSILQKGKVLRTLCGNVESERHKRFYLTALVDIFSVVLSGSNFGLTVLLTLGYVKNKNHTADRSIGHFFSVMHIDAFQTDYEFKNGIDEWMHTFKTTKTLPCHQSVVIKDKPERIVEQKNIINGIRLKKISLEGLKVMSEESGITLDEMVNTLNIIVLIFLIVFIQITTNRYLQNINEIIFYHEKY